MEVLREPQTGDKPALLLDVEGVFLVVNEDAPEVAPQEGFERFSPPDYDFYRPQHGEWVKELQPHFDAYWLTGVGTETLEVLGPRLGLADIPQLDGEYIYGTAPERPKSPREDLLVYKRFAIDYALPGRQLVWIDDWLGPYDIEWAKERVRNGVETLLVRPNAGEGLSRNHVQGIQNWLGGLTASQASI